MLCFMQSMQQPLPAIREVSLDRDGKVVLRFRTAHPKVPLTDTFTLVERDWVYGEWHDHLKQLRESD